MTFVDEIEDCLIRHGINPPGPLVHDLARIVDREVSVRSADRVREVFRVLPSDPSFEALRLAFGFTSESPEVAAQRAGISRQALIKRADRLRRFAQVR
jgi:hypothetical protein